MPKLTDYLLVETFSSIQGEGPSIGTPAFFIRLAGCPVNCKYCDTGYSWSEEKAERVSAEGIYKRFKEAQDKYYIPLVVITGGEPMKYPLDDLMELLIGEGIDIEIETSCYYPLPSNQGCPPAWVLAENVFFICSPKLPSSGSPHWQKTLDNIPDYIPFARAFKFVCADQIDVGYAKDIKEHYAIHRHQVYLMPEAQTREELNDRSEFLVEACKESGVNFSTRLHIQLWGKKRGV